MDVWLLLTFLSNEDSSFANVSVPSSNVSLGHRTYAIFNETISVIMYLFLFVSVLSVCLSLSLPVCLSVVTIRGTSVDDKEDKMRIFCFERKRFYFLTKC